MPSYAGRTRHRLDERIFPKLEPRPGMIVTDCQRPTITSLLMSNSPFNKSWPATQSANSEPRTLSAEHWRSKAEEARLIAEHMSGPFSRQTMENIAENYDKLVVWAERRHR